MSVLEETMLQQIRLAGLPEPERELMFHPHRKWRFDLAWPRQKFAVECEGGVWTQGRHVRGVGFEGDCRKYNEATLHGWRVLRVTRSMIDSGMALAMVVRGLGESQPVTNP